MTNHAETPLLWLLDSLFSKNGTIFLKAMLLGKMNTTRDKNYFWGDKHCPRMLYQFNCKKEELLTYSMEQNHSWEANSQSTSQEIPQLLPFMEPEVSLPSSQDPTTGPCSEPDELFP
jgi:hypothetical protein